jgi:hypothetical protein
VFFKTLQLIYPGKRPNNIGTELTSELCEGSVLVKVFVWSRFKNTLTNIEQQRPTNFEHQEMIEHILQFWLHPNLIDEDDLMDLIYWSCKYYGLDTTELFYDILCVYNKGFWFEDELSALLNVAPKVLDFQLRLDMYNNGENRKDYLFRDMSCRSLHRYLEKNKSVKYNRW